MKIFGNQHGASASGEEDIIPSPTDKSLHHHESELDTYDDITTDIEDEYEDADLAEDDEDYDEEEEEEEEEPDEERRIRRKKRRRIILITVIVVLIVVIGGAALLINYLLNLINYQAANSAYFATVSSPEDLPEESPVSSYLASLEAEDMANTLEATPEELQQWDAEIDDITSDNSTYEVPISDDVFNILLIGSDTRTSGDVGRSDAMIIISVNQKTETIYLTSFLRDCYVAIPGYGHTRLNHSFAYGGPALLEETLETNFKVHIDRYIAVDFYSFMDVIDTLGGIYLDVSEEELKVTDDYIWSMNKLLGEDWYSDYLWNPGYQLLNGKQTLCYARNRYTGNDYARTQRQRTVINQIIKAALKSSPSTLVDLAQVILPQVTTDMSKSEILNYAANVGAYVNYDIAQQQIPAEGTYSNATISSMSVISLDFDSNIDILQSTIYAGTEYED